MPEKWKPESDLAKIVVAAGFNYDVEQDIIYSKMYPWQRNFGYSYPYDLAAPVTISAIIDCEPFFFRYKGKDWMIELWKGQYGLETGGEIGVYLCRRPYLNPTLGLRPHDPENGKFFDCVGDGKRLKMSFALNRKGEPLFRRGPEKHWWLTGFKWGVLSRPEDLTMEVEMTFPNSEMQNAFLDALVGTGYTEFEKTDATVRFVFDKPKTYQSHSDPRNARLIDAVRENNTRIVRTYTALGLKTNDPNRITNEAAQDVMAYFEGFNALSFIERLADHHGTEGRSAQPFAYALKEMERANRTLMRRIGNGFSRFFYSLFG